MNKPKKMKKRTNQNQKDFSSAAEVKQMTKSTRLKISSNEVHTSRVNYKEMLDFQTSSRNKRKEFSFTKAHANQKICSACVMPQQTTTNTQ